MVEDMYEGADAEIQVEGEDNTNDVILLGQLLSNIILNKDCLIFKYC